MCEHVHACIHVNGMHTADFYYDVTRIIAPSTPATYGASVLL